MKLRILIFITAMVSLSHSTNSFAQFAGDVFFQDPSVAASTGGEVSLSLQTFAGADAFGAAQLGVSWPQADLTLISVTPNQIFTDNGGFVVENSGGFSSFVLGNAESLDSPIGTVDLVTVVFRVDAAAGTVIPVDVELTDYLFTDGTQNFGRALGAEIVSTAGLTESVSANDESILNGSEGLVVSIQEGDPLFDRAARLRQPGSELNLIVVEGGVVRSDTVSIAPDADTLSE